MGSGSGLKERLSDVLGRLGVSYVKTLDRVHRHYIVRSSDGSLFILIFTNRVLRRPRSLGIDFEGPMFGVKKYYIDYYLRSGTCDGVVWVYGGDAYIADAYSVREVTSILRTCVKRGYEVICHYPLKSCRRITLNEGLGRFL